MRFNPTSINIYNSIIYCSYKMSLFETNVHINQLSIFPLTRKVLIEPNPLPLEKGLTCCTPLALEFSTELTLSVNIFVLLLVSPSFGSVLGSGLKSEREMGSRGS